MNKKGELATSEIVKMVIAVFVLIIVIVGAYAGYKYYLVSYFKDLGPSGYKEPDLSSSYYQSLIVESNRVASVENTVEDVKWIYDKNGGKTFYYFWKETNSIYLDVPFWADKQVGEISSTGKIKIFDSYTGNSFLSIINNGERVRGQIYKMEDKK